MHMLLFSSYTVVYDTTATVCMISCGTHIACFAASLYMHQVIITVSKTANRATFVMVTGYRHSKTTECCHNLAGIMMIMTLFQKPSGTPRWGCDAWWCQAAWCGEQ